LIALFDDITDRRSLSHELESTKKFLELVVDNIPVLADRGARQRRTLIWLANRQAPEAILKTGAARTPTGLTASDISIPAEAQADQSPADEAAIKKRGPFLVEETSDQPPKDGLRLFLTRRMTVLDGAGDPQYLIKTQRGCHRPPPEPNRGMAHIGLS